MYTAFALPNRWFCIAWIRCCRCQISELPHKKTACTDLM